MSILLQASGLRHTAGAHVLFDGVDLTISSGDRVGLVGHNGSSKTTLLDLLGGQRTPNDGEVRCRRGLRLARVEQFLPAQLARATLLQALIGDDGRATGHSRRGALRRCWRSWASAAVAVSAASRRCPESSDNCPAAREAAPKTM